MYLDEKNQWRPPKPSAPAPRLTDRDERIVLWSVGVFLVSLVIAPIGGASVIHALIAALGL
ncbi:hypothetical protein [Aurantimonas sp. 22II-16-19i]|uniref:hypothetical protein n=1 Tax=Aurantimonas sp. 22II-16-19i TaxID=1317114 RepID=UPI0009F7A48D|nr:hypothetical protein [Aurantimonas sp. 22II-16-19i]ORE97491.1 hypothetical protein ATO4_09232 [Aurantimonas sp. 22II-16-19i]